MSSEASPFVRPVVRRIIERLFSERDLWKSGELVDRVVQEHRDTGGLVVPNPNFTIIRALNDLKSDGLVTSPGHGWWRWTRTEGSADGPLIPEEQATDAIAVVDEEINDIEPAIRPEKEIGNGLECVYLYFNPNDRRLAELEGRCLGVQDWSHVQPRCNATNMGPGYSNISLASSGGRSSFSD